MNCKSKIRWIKNILLILIISMFLPYTLLSERFSNHASDATIVITDTAQKNKHSGGTDVRITRVRIDDEEIPLDDLQKSDSWNAYSNK